MGNILDTRELETEISDLESDLEDVSEEERDEEKVERLRLLTELKDEFDHRAWRDGAALIPEDEWTDYCRQLADDLGYMSGGDKNPLLNHVDWDGWANAVSSDYSTVEFDGVTYYYRE